MWQRLKKQKGAEQEANEEKDKRIAKLEKQNADFKKRLGKVTQENTELSEEVMLENQKVKDLNIELRNNDKVLHKLNTDMQGAKATHDSVVGDCKQQLNNMGDEMSLLNEQVGKWKAASIEQTELKEAAYKENVELHARLSEFSEANNNLNRQLDDLAPVNQDQADKIVEQNQELVNMKSHYERKLQDERKNHLDATRALETQIEMVNSQSRVWKQASDPEEKLAIQRQLEDSQIRLHQQIKQNKQLTGQLNGLSQPTGPCPNCENRGDEDAAEESLLDENDSENVLPIRQESEVFHSQGVAQPNLQQVQYDGSSSGSTGAPENQLALLRQVMAPMEKLAEATKAIAEQKKNSDPFKSKKEQVLTFSGYENTLPLDLWLERIEKRIENHWTEEQKILTAQENLCQDSALVKSVKIQTFSSYSTFVETMKSMFPCGAKKFQVSEWGKNAQRFKGTTFEDWLKTHKGTYLLSKTKDRWDTKNLTPDERSIIMSNLAKMVPICALEQYQHDNDEWKCDELEKITFNQLINGITTKERIDAKKVPNPWEQMYLPDKNRWTKKDVVRVNTLTISTDAAASTPAQADQPRYFDKKKGKFQSKNKSYSSGADRTSGQPATNPRENQQSGSGFQQQSQQYSPRGRGRGSYSSGSYSGRGRGRGGYQRQDNPGFQQSNQPTGGWKNDAGNQAAPPQYSGDKNKKQANRQGNKRGGYRGGRGGQGYQNNGNQGYQNQGNQGYQRNINAVGMSQMDHNQMYVMNSQALPGQYLMPMQAIPAGQYNMQPQPQNNYHFGGNQEVPGPNIPGNPQLGPRGISSAIRQAPGPEQAESPIVEPQRVGNLQLINRGRFQNQR